MQIYIFFPLTVCFDTLKISKNEEAIDVDTKKDFDLAKTIQDLA